MKEDKSIKEIAVRTITEEGEAISALIGSINDDFVKCVELILHSKGRVIVTGIGKSAIIGAKLVASLNSTGTPSVFMHAADAIHAKQADFILDTTVKKEACPNNLAPTSSTTAQMVMGDALTVCLLECRGFTTSDFAKLHPGGALGKQLYLKVADLYIINQVPKVQLTDGIKTIIMEISSKRLGATAVLDNEQLKGIITDGDLRRMLEKTTDFGKITAGDIMNPSPKTVDPDTLVVNALSIMRKNNITQLLVAEKNKYLGVLHLHDILKEGII